MQLNDARKAIYDRFTAAWGSTTAFCFYGEAFDSTQHLEWVRVTVKSLPGSQDTLGAAGNRKFMRTGIIFVQITVPDGEGTSRADQLAQLVSTIFEGTRFSGIWVYETNVQEQDSDDKNLLYLVESTFNYEDIK